LLQLFFIIRQRQTLRDRVLDFFYFQDDRDGDFVANLIAYFDNAHNKLKDDDLSPVYSATTLRG